MPPFLEAIRLLKAERPDLAVIIPAAPTVAASVKEQAAGLAHVVEGEAAKLSAMKAATVAVPTLMTAAVFTPASSTLAAAPWKCGMAPELGGPMPQMRYWR